MAQGSGLPFDKSSPVIAQPTPGVNADSVSSAEAWSRIASIGEKLSADGFSTIQREVHLQQAGAVADFENHWREQNIAARDRFAKDPDGFKNWADASYEGAISNVPTWMVPHAKAFLGRSFDATHSTLLGEKRAQDDTNANNAMVARRKSADDDVMALAIAGKVGSPEFAAAVETHNAVLDSIVQNGRMAPEAAQILRDDLAGRAAGEQAAREGVSLFAEKGFDTAVKHLRENILENDQLSLKTADRYKIFNRGVAAIRLAQKEQQADKVGVVELSRDLRARISSQQPFDEGEVTDALQSLSRVGANSEYARLSKDYAVYQATDRWRNNALSPSEFANDIAGLRNQVAASKNAGSPQAKQAYDFFVGVGYSPAAAAGIVGNLIHESGLNPNASHDQGTGIGVAGWRLERRQALQAFAAARGKSENDFQTQLEFVDRELKTSEGRAGEALASAKTPAEAAAAFVHFERPLNYDPNNPSAAHGFSNRVANASAVSAANGGPAVEGGDAPYAGEITKRAQTLFVDQMRKNWPQMKSMPERGRLPTPEDFEAIRYAAQLSGDATWISDVESFGKAQNIVAATKDLPPSQQQAAIEQAKVAAGQGGFSLDADSVLKNVEAEYQRQQDLLDKDPVGYWLQQDQSRKPPAPLNVGDQQSFRSALTQRGQIVGRVAASTQTVPASALRPAELAQVQAALAAADPRGKARIYSDLVASLPEPVRNATLAQLGAKDSAAMVEAYAGALMPSVPDVAESIIRGQQAMKVDGRNDPTKQDKSGFNDALDKMLPQGAFPVSARTNPTGAYATMRNAVIARYADLTAQDPNKGKDFAEARLEQAVTDVTGGVLKHNSGSLVAPRRGMSQAKFDGILNSINDIDLAGVTTLNGEPVTAKYLRSSARLESVGDGRYMVLLGSDPLRPIYAFRNAGPGARENTVPTPFVLDLRGRDAPAAPVRGVEFKPYPRG